MSFPKGNNANPNGAPKKAINWKSFEALCEMQATQKEIANVLGIGTDTLRIRVQTEYKDDYLNIYHKFADNGKCSLRRYQFALAKTNTAMAIWLGKQWLGQKENNLEILVSEEVAKKFEALMGQLTYLQSTSKTEPNQISNDKKS
jgi:hypothetical protein